MTTSLKWTLSAAILIAGLGFASALAQSPAPAAPATDPGQAVQVANAGKRPIVAVYSSPPGRADWSDDMLGKGVIKPGGSAKLKLKAKPDSCTVDVSAMLDNGETRTQKNIDMCAAAPTVGF